MLLSIVVPTHERSRYAIPTIDALLSLGELVEVVVTDTSAVDEISDAIATHPGASRLKLVRPGRKMNVVENFNAGLQAATGTYLAFIGDDDFVMPQIVELARWATINRIDALMFTTPVLYFWPDFHHKRRGTHYAGTLHVNNFDSAVAEHDVEKAMSDAMDNFGGGVMEMPRAYAGMIARELALNIVAKYGSLFGGVSPDIYSATLIASESKRCVRIDYPIIVSGASGASTAGLSANGRHVGGLRENAHIGAFANLEWDARIPEFYSVPTVWSYSFLKALERIGYAKDANLSRLYVKCFLYHRSYFAETWNCYIAYTRDIGRLRAAVRMIVSTGKELTWIAKKLWRIAIGRISPASTGRVIRDVRNTKQALSVLLGELSERPLMLKK
jgi:glycosyltransferase involved in cell wall biosynthesis